MAAPSKTTRPASKSYRRQALLWLMMTLILGVGTALVWMFSQTPAAGAKIENAPIAAPQALGTELEQPLSVEALHELDTDVQPINFEDTVRDLRNYPDEFKDKSYLLANKGKWTVQVMNVAENEVIASYLEGREDREKFSYFRYRDEDNQLRYMLTYGLMSSPQEAVGAAKLVDFGLPADVRVLPEEINRYVGIIDNYERPKPIKDLSTKRSRTVRLQPTKREVPVRQKAQAPTESSTGDSATNNGNERDSNQAAADNSREAESIQQSKDTSATLSVNEERRLSSEEGANAQSATKKDDKPRKTEQEAKKLPVVPTPKPPNSANNSEKNNTEKNSTEKNSASSNSNNANSNGNKASANTGNKNKDTGAAKANNDSIKELIEEKAN